jgi:hypothetical protein
MAIRDRGTNYFVDYEDNGFGGDMFGGYGGGIASLPAAPVPAPAPAPVPAQEPDYYARQFAPDIFSPVAAPAFTDPSEYLFSRDVERDPERLPIAPPVETPVEFQPSFIERAPIAPPVETPVEPSLIGASVPAMAQPEVQNTGVFGLPSLAQQQAQTVQPVAPVQPAAPTGPAPETINALSQQILGQGLTSKWSGEGYGSAEKNAADMAKILAGIGITDIKQFGKVPQYEQAEVQYGINGNVAHQNSEGNYYIMVPGGTDSEGNQMMSAQYIDQSQLNPIYGFRKTIDSEGNTSFEAVDPSKVITKDGVPMVQTGETFGNKITGQAVPNTYSERQTGNFFGGTFEGKGNTGYGVQFDAQGNPIFYTQGASSNDLARIMKDLGPIGQIALAAATGGMSLPAQLATNAGIQLLAGGNLGDIVKGTALSYLGGQAGNLISGSSGITDLLGKTGTEIASKTAQQYVGSGGKADLGQALLGSAVSSGVNNVVGELPGLDSLSATDRNLTSNLIAAVATGTPIEQAIQNAFVGKASSEARNAVAEARNAAPAPQTYEDLMAGIEPKMSSTTTPDTGPSNDDILKQIGYEPEPTTVEPEPTNVSELLRSLQPYAEPTQEGRTLPQERPQITQEPIPTEIPINVDKLLGQLPSQEQTSPVADNLINKAVTDTLGTKTENAAEPATEKGKAMDDIDYSQIFGDYGINIADEIAKAGTSGNASSIFSGDGGIDLSALATNFGDEDQAAPPANLDLGKILYNDTGNPETTWEQFYKSGMQEGLDESNLINLSPEERARYEKMKSGDTQDYDALAAYLRERPQDMSGPDADKYFDEFNKNFNPAGGFGSQYQTVGTNRVMINDDGTATILDPTTGQSSYLTQAQTAALIKNGTLNSKSSGYIGATGGKGTTPGGAKASTAAKTTAKTGTSSGTSPGTNNTGLIMALMAMMAMMNNKGGGSSSAASSIPALSANRSQLPYAPVGRPGAGGQNYFSPTTYTAKAAEGGLMGLAGGGMSDLGGYSDGGRLLKGPGDGVSDSIPATIGGKQPARLATGEFVVPARIVSELGNGSTEAGAKKLYAMMDRVQKARRKTKNVAADTKAHKYLPA